MLLSNFQENMLDFRVQIDRDDETHFAFIGFIILIPKYR